MKLFCSDRNSFQPAGVIFIFNASSFGLLYNHGKLGILNYHKDLVLQWLKGSKQLLCTQNVDFRKSGKIILVNSPFSVERAVA